MGVGGGCEIGRCKGEVESILGNMSYIGGSLVMWEVMVYLRIRNKGSVVG